MTDLLYTPADHVGGLHLIRFVPVIGLLPIPATGGPIRIQPAHFRPGYRWLQAYSSPFSSRYEETPDETDPGTVYAVTVEAFLPGPIKEPIRSQLDLMMRLRFIVEVTDLNGDVRQVGTPTEGLSFVYRFRSGQQIADRPGCALIWNGSLQAPPGIG